MSSSRNKRPRPDDEEAVGTAAKRAASLFDDEDSDGGAGSDANSLASIESFDDGYDSDLMGDEEDRDQLDALPEVEREAALAKRHETREAGRELVEVRREALTRRRAAVTAKAAPSKAKPKPAARRGRLRRRDAEEEGEDEDGGSSSEEEMPEYAGRVRAAVDGDEEDSDYETSKRKSKGKSAGARKRAARSIWDDDEDLYGGAEEEEFGAGEDGDGGVLGGAVAVSDAVMTRVAEEAGRERSEALTLDVVNASRAKRDFLASTFHEPWFKRAVRGLPVRLYLGTTESGQERYRLGRVAEVVRHGRPYTLQLPTPDSGAAATSRAAGSRIKTDRCLLVYVAHRDEGRPFPISRVSNGRVTPAELLEFLSHLTSEGREAPRPAWLLRKAAEVKGFSERHTYTPEEVAAMLEQRSEALDPAAVRNLAMLRAAAHRRIDLLSTSLFEALALLATDKTTVRLPADKAEEPAAVETAIAALPDDASKAKARALLKRSEASRASLTAMLARLDRESNRRMRRETEKDPVSGRSTTFNRSTARKNKDRRQLALQRTMQARRKHQERIEADARAVAAAKGVSMAEALAEAKVRATDPIKQRDARAEAIWTVQSSSEAAKSAAEREARKAAAGKGGGKAAAEAAADEAGAEDGGDAAKADDAAGSAGRLRGLVMSEVSAVDADALIVQITSSQGGGSAGPAGGASRAPAAKAAKAGGGLSLSELLKRRRAAKQ